MKKKTITIPAHLSRAEQLAAIQNFMSEIYSEAESRFEETMMSRGVSRGDVRELIAEHRDATEAEREGAMANVELILNAELGDPSRVH